MGNPRSLEREHGAQEQRKTADRRERSDIIAGHGSIRPMIRAYTRTRQKNRRVEPVGVDG
jgi:hypothetical protein